MNYFLILGFIWFCLWLLRGNITKRSKRQELSDSEPHLDPWSWIQLIISQWKWTQNKSPTKLSFVERLYSERRLKPALKRLFRMFNINLVFNDDFESISNSFYDRKNLIKVPASLSEIIAGGKNRGFLWNDGEVWKELRKYTITKLARLGFGKRDNLLLTLSNLLPKLLDNLENLKKETDNNIPIKNLFGIYVINVIWGIIGGKTFSDRDEKFTTLQTSINIIFYFPIWKQFFISRLPNNRFVNKLLGTTTLYASLANIEDYFRVFVESKLDLSNRTGEPQDFVEHFLLEMEKYKEHEKLKHIYCKDQLIAVLKDLLAAGLDTTTKYLEMSVMYMLLNPRVQRKVQEEIDSVIGENDIPSYGTHKQSMPYFCATMMEIHRMGGVIPTVGRYIPTVINGNAKKQDTIIINMIWAVRMDDLYWGDPHTFRPERFLAPDNTLIIEKVNRVMPFGAGPRNCPGESVASASTFTFLAAILQKYTISRAYENEFVGLAKELGIITQPEPFHIHLETRKIE